MSMFLSVLVPIAVGVVATESMFVHYYTNKRLKRLKQEKNLYQALSMCHNEGAKWRQKGPSFYRVDVFPYRLNLFDEEGTIRVQCIKKGEIVLDIAVDKNQHVYTFRNHCEEWFDLRAFVQGDEKLYRDWASALQDRWKQEEQTKRMQHASSVLHAEWLQYKEEEKQSFQNMMDMLSNVPSLYLQQTGDYPLWLDHYFSFMCERDEENVRCELAFSNGTILFESETNRMTGQTEFRFRSPHYLSQEQREKCQAIVQTLIHSPSKPNQTLPKIADKPITIPLVFQEIVQQINALAKESEWLTDNETHLIHYTYPQDLQDVMEVYRKLSEEGKEQAQAIVERSKKEWNVRLERLTKSIEERKLRRLEERVRIVETRVD